jgi:predicted Zn finger-like uncharacterized protein
MSLIVDCPSCQRKLRVPDDLLGLNVKCPSCATMFTAQDSQPAPPAAPPAADAPAPGETPPAPPPAEGTPSWLADVGGTPPAAPQSPPAAGPTPPPDRRACPACGQSIPIEATRCRHCGEPVAPKPSAQSTIPDRRDPPLIRRDSEPHRGTLILVLGILSIVLGTTWFLSLVSFPMGIAAWMMGQGDLRKMRMGNMDPQGEGMTQAGWICGIIGTVISGLFGLCCLGYIGFIVFAVAAGSANNPGRPPTTPRRRIAVEHEGIPHTLPEYFPQRIPVGK